MRCSWPPPPPTSQSLSLLTTRLAREAALQEIARRELARRSLLDFTLAFTPNYLPGWIHREVTDLLDAFMQAVHERRSPRLIIQLPPRHGKSTIVSRCFPPFLLGHHPDWEVVCATYNQDLSNDMGRDVRAILRDPLYAQLFPDLKIRTDSNAVDYVKLESRGSYTAVGIGGALTGRGAHVLLIDDPVKNREDADSELMRATNWKWYQSVARTRLAPGGGAIVCQCMTGDTPVRRPDGSDTPLRDIRPGDMIATYEDGTLATARVRHWRNCGPDRILAIRMMSGTVVRANARHPFLVARPEGPTWVRLAQLQPNDCILRVGRGDGKVSRAASPGALNPCPAKDGAGSTTDATGGPADGDPQPTTQPIGGTLISGTATESPSWSSMLSSSPRADGVPCASSPPAGPTSGGIGADSALTTTTPPEKSAGSCATTAISLSGTVEPPTFSWLRQTTFGVEQIASITPAGVEDVFDIEVERTENFIANGLVSHNTRWHEEDLAGMLQIQQQENPDGDKWMVYSYPAIATADEKNRLAGEALHPERFPVHELLKLKNTIDAREWSALYQQNPVPAEGLHIKREWMKWARPATTNLNWYLSTDFAIGEKTTNDYTVLAPFAVDEHDDIYFAPPVRGRMSAEAIVEAICDLTAKHKPVQIAIENVHISKTIGPFLKKRLRERGLYPPMWDFTATNDKLARTASLRGRMQQGKVFLPPAARPEVELELLSFPAGRHDDIVDAFAVACIMLDKLRTAAPPPKAGPKEPPKWSMEWMKKHMNRTEKDEDRYVLRRLNGKPRPRTERKSAWTG